jgi:hypothetical protein
MPDSNDRRATSSALEDLFAELFTQVLGPEKVQFLSPQHPVTDISGASRFIRGWACDGDCQGEMLVMRGVP